MKRKRKPQKRKIEKKNNTLSWNKFLQISEIYEIREYNKNINNYYDKEGSKECVNKDKDINIINKEKLDNKANIDDKLNNNKRILKEELKNIKSKNNVDENNKLNSNINSEFKNIAYDPKGSINKYEAEIVQIKSDGNYLYRCIAYFLFNDQNYFQMI